MKKRTVTVGIPAYNEEKNIKKLLLSILEQKEVGFSIEKIIVLIDGATDQTEQQASRIKSKKLVIRNDKKRKGKTERINQLIQMLSSDILVLLDADVVLKTSDTITNLIKPLEDSSVGLTGGKLIQENNKTFWEKSIYRTVTVYEAYLESIRNGNNIFAIKGPLLALSKSLAKKIHIPADVYANDAYLYFACITKGYTFRYTKNANAWYKVPSNFKDQVAQNNRFASAEKNLSKYFGNIVKKEYTQEPRLLYLLMIKAFIQDPIHSFAIFLVNQYSKKQSENQSPKWKTVTSTK